MNTLKKTIVWITSPIILHSMHIWVRVMVFNATFNNISVISWRSFLLVEETGEFGENHQAVVDHLRN
jgi:hypothetical protein